MPNTHSTLTGLFTDIASAIREKDGSSSGIVADAFPSAIRAIPTGGGADHDAEDGIVMRTISTYENSRVTTIGSNAFTSCRSLTTVSFPVCKTIYSDAFNYCTSLTTASFPACTSIYSYAFRACFHLLSLYLYGSSVCVLGISNAFSSTPIAGYTTSTSGVYGSIFVPMSLLSAYQSSTNWTYFSSRFVGVNPEDM